MDLYEKAIGKVSGYEITEELPNSELKKRKREKKEDGTKKPSGVLICTVLFIILGILVAIYLALMPNELFTPGSDGSTLALMCVVLIFYFYIAYEMWSLGRKGRFHAIILSILTIIFVVFPINSPIKIPILIVIIGVLYFLFINKETKDVLEINQLKYIGSVLIDLKEYEGAVKKFREVIRIDPEDADTHYVLGALLQHQLKRYEEAEKEYREAIRINPKDAKAHIGLGLLLQKLKRYEEAEKEYREAIRINPELAVAHDNLNVLLQKLKKQDIETEKLEIIK